MDKIKFYICAAVRAPIKPGDYIVDNKAISVSYPGTLIIAGGPVELPRSLSTMFVVSWEDQTGKTAAELQGQSFARHLPVFDALGAISELLLAYKLVRLGHYDGTGVRTIGIGDTLIYSSEINGVSTGDLNVRLKIYGENSAWSFLPVASGPHGTTSDPHGTSELAAPHIGADTLPVARRYVRCYELLEHGFYSEAFIVSFSILDDFVQSALDDLLCSKGLSLDAERKQFLREIKENRLKVYLGPLLKLVFGKSIAEMWPESEAAIEWLNKTRNGIAHRGQRVDYETAAKGVYGCIKIIHALQQSGAAQVDLNNVLLRHARLTAAWTRDRPSWIPDGDPDNLDEF